MADRRSPYLSDYWVTGAGDKLRFADYRQALERIILEAQTPLTVGIFGPWGSGKTSLMRMLKEEIDKKEGPPLRTAWITAWKYDRHPALWRAFILRVIEALYPRENGRRIPLDELPNPKQQEDVRKLDRLARSLYETVEWQEFGRWGIDWSKAGREAVKLPLYLWLTTMGLEALAEKLGLDLEMAELVRREVDERRMVQLASMEQFEETFKKTLGTLMEGGRLIVFVDDLDRCLPEKAIEVLEAIKLFLEVEGTVFVLGMDPEVIRRGIEGRYAALFRREGDEREELPIRGDVYLQKIVQIPFYLPPLGDGDVEAYIQALVPGTNAMDEVTPVFAAGLFPNPRQVKRVLNIFHLLREIGQARKLPISAPLLAKTVLIQTQWPKLYAMWRQYPTLVRTLEKLYRRYPGNEAAIEAGVQEETAEREKWTPRGGLLDEYLTHRHRYRLLERLLRFPPDEDVRDSKVIFAQLTREEIMLYLRLAGTVGAEAADEVLADLLSELLSGDVARIEDALARLETEESKRRLRWRMLRAMRDDGRYPPPVRVGAGYALAKLGDPRFRPDAWYLPKDDLLGFVRIPAGPFLMGTPEEEIPALLERLGGKREVYEAEAPQHEVALPEYYIARYPVTVAQWRAYLEDTGRKPKDDNSLRDPANHPVRFVTWYEAVAYCAWLTERLRGWEGTPEPLRRLLVGEDGRPPWRITLPSEAEWEKAARGEDGWRYPWGNDPDPNCANYDESGIGTTSAVGCFPGGASPWGVEEMSGNVWEWTRSLYRDYPYKPGKERENLKANGRRVLRGGSFSYNLWNVRCAYRGRGSPNYHWGNGGFRVVVASPFSTSER